MSVTITEAGLVAVQPEWSEAWSQTPDVVTHAVDQANALELSGYSNETKERHRRYLEAAAILFQQAFGRDMFGRPVENIHRKECQRLDSLVGGAERAPGWDLPTGVS